MTTQVFQIADLFCGAGGSSTGAQRAIADLGGTMDLVAVNHWNVAIATHSANHPEALHVVEDVSLVKPQDVVPAGHLHLLMASPECTFFSRARGGKPVHDQGRMNPWVIHRWLTDIDVDHVLVENVPEFTNWGPLDEDGRPIKARQGEYFQAWFLTFQNLGYRAEWRMLNAADYGDATTRTRFFLLANRGDRPVCWPEPTHAKMESPMFPGLRPWRPAREIIDWGNLGRSLFDDPKYRKQPLAENTLKRIAKGLRRFGGPMAPLFVRLLDLGDEAAADWGDLPIQAFILNRHGENGGSRAHSTDAPMPTVTCQGAGYLVEPEAAPFVQANRTDNSAKGIDEPVPCVTTAYGGGSILVEPELRPFLLGQQSAGVPRETEQPVPTISTGGKIRLVRPFITHYYSGSVGQTFDTPLSGIAGEGQHHGIVDPVIIEYYSGSDAVSVDAPLPTVTTRDRHGIVNPMVVQMDHTGRDGNHARPTELPISTITGKNRHGLATPTLVKAVTEEAEAAGIDPRRIVFIDGEPHVLDIRFRMLENSELARAMGFSDAEQEYEFTGNKTEVTKQIGNAVPVNMAAALVKAALAPEGS